MRCPFCRIESMHAVVSGDREVDRCLTCGATWFDEGEIRELLEGRQDGAANPPSQSGTPAETAPPGAKSEVPTPTPEEIPTLRALHKTAPGLGCPRCGRGLTAISFRATEIPLVRCRECRGYLVTRPAARAIAAKLAIQRENRDALGALGESLAAETRRRMLLVHGPGGDLGGEGRLPLPVVVPLSDAGPAGDGVPFVTWSLVGVMVAVQILANAGVLSAGSAAGIALPSGSGFTGVPRDALVFSLFLHGGVVPLVLNSLFIFVLGDNVEDRMGRMPYAVFVLLCGATANAAHVLWGPPGAPAALGAAGVVAGIVGSYLVFFPSVAIRMYRMGEVATVPAYLFACVWVATVFLSGRGPLEEFLFAAPLSLHGSVAGLGAGVLGGIAWRSLE